MSAREREEGCTGSGKSFLGCGLDLELGQIAPPGPISIFIFFSSFLFLFYLFLL
jgi:hypothetical protein